MPTSYQKAKTMPESQRHKENVEKVQALREKQSKAWHKAIDDRNRKAMMEANRISGHNAARRHQERQRKAEAKKSRKRKRKPQNFLEELFGILFG
jgi:hypothetical protein